MNPNHDFDITEDICAFMERDGANYTGNLVVQSENLDDYDIYRLDEDGDWELVFDSLSNKSDELDLPKEVKESVPCGWTSWLWEKAPGFAEWATEMKALVPKVAKENDEDDEPEPKIYQLVQKSVRQGTFKAEGTLDEIAAILTASGAQIVYLDESALQNGWDALPEAYDGPGWYYSTSRDDELRPADGYEDAIRSLAGHDCTYSLTLV